MNEQQPTLQPKLSSNNSANSSSESHTPLLWVPFALRGLDMKTQGTYKNAYPQGAVIHYTAGRFDTPNHALNTIKDGTTKGYCYFVIDYDGVVYQNAPLDCWGYHAGDSYYPGVGHGVSSRLVGIELCNAGTLIKIPNGKNPQFKTWYGQVIPREQVRTSLRKDNIKPGHYHKYSLKQEESLLNLLLFLYTNNPSTFNFKYVVGHDEVAPDRKSDPGASLSMSMPDYRAFLRSSFLERNNKKV